MNRLKQVLCAATAVTLLGMPASHAQEEKELVFGWTAFLSNFHPLIQVNNTKRLIINMSLRPISAFNAEGENVCVLCEELPTIENGLAEIVEGEDGNEEMRVTFTLKEGLSWGDGTPVTTDDVLFTFEMANDPEIGFSNYNPWTRASDIEAVDDRTFVIHLPELTMSYNAWDHILPEHIERPIYEASPDLESYVQQTQYNQNTTNPGLWNGSYIISDYVPGTRTIFEINPHWPGLEPDIDRVIYSYRDNNQALLQAAVAGEVQALKVSAGAISMSQLLDLRRAHPDRFQYMLQQAINLERLAVQLENPILEDIRVRRAIIQGIDRATILDILFEGLLGLAHTVATTESPFYTNDVQQYEYDPEAALALLAEAGWTPGGDGVCVDENGNRLSIELMTLAGNATREQIALVIQDQLRDVCIDIRTNFAATQEFNGTFMRQREFEGLAMSSVGFTLATSPGIALHSNAIPTEDNNWVGNNFSGYSSPQMDEAIDNLESSLNMEDQVHWWGEVQKIFSDDLPMIPLYFNDTSWVAPTNLGNFVPNPYEVEMIWAEEWTLD